MRLLIDEMYSAAVAEGLRARGHDAISVVEREDLRGCADASIFAAAQDERRAVVTENLADFIEIANDRDARGILHHALVLVHPAKYPRSVPRTEGAIITELDALLGRFPSDEPSSARIWL